MKLFKKKNLKTNKKKIKQIEAKPRFDFNFRKINSN